MSLFPFIEDENEVTSQVSSIIKEYEIDFTTGRLTGRIATGVDALAIWAYLALKTKRYDYLIYSWSYGEELSDLIGNSYSEEYLSSEVKRCIEECLTQNEHITGIDNLSISNKKEKLNINFKLITDIGEVDMNV
jgi:hypothetical protein